MQIIKLNATDSTNLYLKDLMNSKPVSDYTVVMADVQLKGRGQMGTNWDAEPGKNLTFSVLKKLDKIELPNIFILNICVSLAIYHTLSKLNVPNLKIKWPNDILSGTSKICGILIENMLLGNRVNASVIGIGLNINQTNFKGLPRVSSLRLLLGDHLSLDMVMGSILKDLENTFLFYESNGILQLKKEYDELLFRKDKPSTFQDIQGKMFMGFIRGVSDEGKLVVELEDEITKNFNLKEIKLLY